MLRWWVALPLATTMFMAVAFAAGPIDMTAVLTDESGRPIPDVAQITNDDPGCSRCSTLTLGAAAAHALFALTTEEQRSNSVTAEQKWQRAALAMRIKTDPKATLTAEEVALIKARIGIVYGGMVVLRAYAQLDPGATPPPIR